MARLLRILTVGGAGLIAILVAAYLTRAAWLPERFAVNVPVRTFVGPAPEVPRAEVEDRLRLPPGLRLTRFAAGLTNARFLRVTKEGDVVVSQPRSGRVALLVDRDGDGVSDQVIELLTGLDRPHGLALRDGYLYVAEMTGVGRIRFDAAARVTSGVFERLITGLPSGGNHWTRTIGFGPDGFLYVSVGSSCNVCIEPDVRRAAISRYDPSTWRGSVFASGLRNAVGFAWRSMGEGETREDELIATDNGRDLLGNDFPPCELNRVVEGGFYGWPFANGNRIPDPDFGVGHEREIESSLPPIHSFPAHNAPLGLAFLEAEGTPPGFRGAALVALHGSWNRTTKDGYKVVSLHWDEKGGITQRDFLTGFLVDDHVIGRPVDVAQGPDGAIYVSDDYGGSIFRITAGPRGDVAPDGLASPARAPDVARPSPREPAGSKERGALVWQANLCDQCHDPEIIGNEPGRTAKILEHLGDRYDTLALMAYFKAPQPPMPLFDLNDAERRDLAAYVLDRFR